MPEKNNNITYEIKEHIGTISSWDSGWNRELNLISWNGAKPKYDIREWDHDHERMSKGITLYPWEMRSLVDLYLTNNSEKAVAEGRAREAERQRRRARYRRTDSEGYGLLEDAKEDGAADASETGSDGAAALPDESLLLEQEAPADSLLQEQKLSEQDMPAESLLPEQELSEQDAPAESLLPEPEAPDEAGDF